MKWYKTACRVAVVAALQVAVTPVWADCRQAPDDHLVGNAGCVLVKGTRVLMVQQRLTGRWGVPGGTAEDDERAVCTAARETREETGLKVRVERHLMTLDDSFHLFRCSYEGEQKLDPQDMFEIRAVDWQDARQRAALSWRFPSQRKKLEVLMRQETGEASASRE